MSDIPRCKTCKHWVPPPKQPFLDAGECRRLASGDSGLWVVTYENWDSIETSPDFGCVEHEEKP